MLVYANYLSFQGAGARDAIFKAIGGWLKEQVGFGLHPDQLRREGAYSGHRGDVGTQLRIHATGEEEPELYAWILRNPDGSVRGREWITEIGVRIYGGLLELSCVVRTEEHSTLVAAPVMASRPRVIGYAIYNVEQSPDADFAESVPGVTVKSVGQDRDSYRALLAEIDRSDRVCPIVLVSPTRDGDYLFNVSELQQKLVGLGQVVQITPDFNSYEMAEVVGQHRSAWSGAANILYAKNQSGYWRNRLFLSEEIIEWGDAPIARISQILAWVTSTTNVLFLRKRIKPEDVMQLALRRGLQAVRERGDQMDASQLREEIDRAGRLATEQAEWIKTLEDENVMLESEIANTRAQMIEDQDNLRRHKFVIQGLKTSLENAGAGRTSTLDAEALLGLICNPDSPSPFECLEAIENVHSDKCIVLESAKESAKRMDIFVHGRRLLDMLRRLVTDYRVKLVEGGDSAARMVFAKNEYAAKESETVMGNSAMRRQRVFEYDGEAVEMFRHLKIGTEDNVATTIRVHFHWDARREKIVIAYCGEHFRVSSH